MGITEKLPSIRLVRQLFVLLCVLSTPVQSGQSSDTSRNAQEAQAQAIPVGRITPEAESVEDMLATARDDLLETQFSSEIVKSLERIEKDIREQGLRLDTTLGLPPSHEALEQQKSVWEAIKDESMNQIRLLEGRIAEYETYLGKTEFQTKVWDKTRTEARRESAPSAIAGRINSVLKALKSQNRRLRNSRNEILDLQNRAAGLLKSIDESLDQIKFAQHKIESGIFAAQSLPVWHLESNTEELTKQIELTRSIYSRLHADTLDYIQSNIDRMITHGLLIALLGWFLLRKRRTFDRNRGSNEPDSAGLAYSTLRHPWSAALLLGILLMAFTFPDRTLGFKLLMTIIGVSVWIRVISSMLSSAFLGPVLALALIALADLLRSSFSGYGELNRWMLTLVVVAGIVTFYGLGRIQRKTPLTRITRATIWTGVFNAWIRLCQLLLVLALAAVLFGYSLLADRLNALAISGSIFASALLFGVLLFESVVQSMVNERAFDRIRMVRANREAFLNVVRLTLRLLGFCAWFYLVLRNIKLLGPFQEWATTLLTTELGRTPVLFSIGDLLAFALTLWLSWLIAHFLTYALTQEVFTRLRVGAGIPFAITTFTRYTVLVLGFVAALVVLGFPLDKVTLLLSALGVGIGFGLQNITNNFISGIILLFERPIRVGDKIQLDDLVGTVASIGIRASTIRGFDGSDVIVPNGDFISARVTNWTLADQQRRIVLPVRVAYGTEPEKVLELLHNIALANSEVLKTPPPEALFRGFGVEAMDFELRAWTESGRGWIAVMSDLAIAVVRGFREADIQIPIPQRDLKISNIPDLGLALAKAMKEAGQEHAKPHRTG